MVFYQFLYITITFRQNETLNYPTHIQVSANSPLEWAQLTNSCNNKQECTHIYTGAVIDSCLNNYIADYMEIHYDCLLSMSYYYFYLYQKP